MNSLIDTIVCLKAYLPYVDQAIVIEGGGNDDSLYYLRNWSQEEPKLKVFLVPWKDNFSEQRNEYLKRVPDNSWVLVSDPDEVFMPDTLQKLQPLIEEAERRGKDMIGFQCRSVSLKGEKRV